MDRRRTISMAFAVALLAAVWAAPSVGAAVTIEAPSQVLDSVDVTVTVDPLEPTGTVCVLAGGRVVASRLATPGAILRFADVDVGHGDVTLYAAVRHPGGMEYSQPVAVKVWGRPGKPVLVKPAGGYAAEVTMVTVRPGSDTTLVDLYLNGAGVRSIAVVPGRDYPIAKVRLPQGTSTLEFVVRNPVSRAEHTYQVKRLDYPWPTCIIIDQSDFRLYWIRDGQLVKAYPIAHGKASTPTPNRNWRILAKYMTDPGSVYGPRKMRLFKQTSSGYVYTAYGIHGTNQPWVIGTRASRGCIRMYNKDVLELYPQVPLGTMVQTRP